MDVGTAFGGIGSSREMMIASLAEPAMLLIVFTVALVAGTTQLSSIAAHMIACAGRACASRSGSPCSPSCSWRSPKTPASRSTIPATHLELTMVHEAMVLEYSGRHLAMIEAAAALKLVLYFSLADLPVRAVRHGDDGPEPRARSRFGIAAYLGKLVVLAVVLPIGETAVAKMRVFRYPVFLGGAFAAAALAVFLLFVSQSF